jgi:hypothetical protein
MSMFAQLFTNRVQWILLSSKGFSQPKVAIFEHASRGCYVDDLHAKNGVLSSQNLRDYSQSLMKDHTFLTGSPDAPSDQINRSHVICDYLDLAYKSIFMSVCMCLSALGTPKLPKPLPFECYNSLVALPPA